MYNSHIDLANWGVYVEFHVLFFACMQKKKTPLWTMDDPGTRGEEINPHKVQAGGSRAIL